MSLFRRTLPGLGLGLLTALSSGPSSAQEKKPSKYPKVNVATAYVVDARWPQRPEGMTWGHVPGLAIDANDHVYVFTRAENPVQVYDAAGNFVRSWGKGAFKSAHHIRVGPDGSVWTTDTVRHVVEKHTPEGKRLLTLGTPDHPGQDDTHFNQPTDVAVTPEGDVYVSDGYGNARVVHFDRDGKFVRAWGRLGSKPGEFSTPHSIAYCKGKVYVADRNNVRVQVFDRAGKLLDVWNNLIVPWGFAVTKDDELWVCGSSPMQWRATDGSLGCPPKDQLFMKFTPEGRLLHLWTVPKGLDGLERPGEVNWVHCIAVDSKGNLYAGDIVCRRAQKFTRVAP